MACQWQRWRLGAGILLASVVSGYGSHSRSWESGPCWEAEWSSAFTFLRTFTAGQWGRLLWASAASPRGLEKVSGPTLLGAALSQPAPS